MKFGDNLRKLRKSKGISQEELADKVKVSRQSVSKWETGEAYPEMNNILQLCKIFNCPINSLVADNLVDLDSLGEEVKMSVVKFKEDKQKKMRGLSKAICVISSIIKVAAVIGMVVLALAMVAVPIVGTNVKAENNTLEIFSKEIKYERDDNHITFKDGNKKETVKEHDDVEALNHILDYVEENNMTKVSLILEVGLVFGMVLLVLTYRAFNYLKKLFHNLHVGDTPFTMENVMYIKKMSTLMILIIVAKVIFSGILASVIVEDMAMSIELNEVLYILILYSLSYVFEYGYYIQQDSNGKMYGDINE